jgi:hypothetical protein
MQPNILLGFLVDEFKTPFISESIEPLRAWLVIKVLFVGQPLLAQRLQPFCSGVQGTNQGIVNAVYRSSSFKAVGSPRNKSGSNNVTSTQCSPSIWIARDFNRRRSSGVLNDLGGHGWKPG